MQAVIRDGLVLGVLDGQIPDGVDIPAGVPVSVGWQYDGGEFLPPEPQVAHLDGVKAHLVGRIDDRAAATYARWTRFEAEYRARESAAQAFKDAGYQGDPGLCVSSFAEPAGLTTRAATDAILVQAAALRAAQDALSALRMRKYEVARSTTTEAAQTLADEIIAAMDEIARGIG